MDANDPVLKKEVYRAVGAASGRFPILYREVVVGERDLIVFGAPVADAAVIDPLTEHERGRGSAPVVQACSRRDPELQAREA